MCDVDAAGLQLAGHRLGEASQGEHGEGGRLSMALDARRGGSEENRAAILPHHAPCRPLADQDAPVGGDGE
jgi:hypothetical protein